MPYLHSNPACPTCGNILDGASHFYNPLSETMPKANDLAVCVYCGSFLTYTASLCLRLLTPDEIVALSDSARIDIIRAREFIDSINMKRRAK